MTVTLWSCGEHIDAVREFPFPIVRCVGIVFLFGVPCDGKNCSE